MAQIGKFRHRVTIQSPTITRSARGAEVLTWSSVATVYADIRTAGGSETTLSTQLEVATLTHSIQIRYRTGIVPKMRAVWGSRVFSIESVGEPDNRMRTLVLSCREIVGDTGVA